MGTASPYRWDFSVDSRESVKDSVTFSVGIYQWIPKNGRNGLKKSKTIRVTGYVADPTSLYAKAEELCALFNAEGVRADSPPVWMQKQYSVPKPSDLKVARKTKDLSPKEVRAIRRRVMKQILLPAGFIQSHASTYVRRVGEIIQVVHFRTMTWGGSFTVDIGLHYTFTPPIRQQQIIRLAEFDIFDCAVHGQLDRSRPSAVGSWIPFGTSASIIEQRLVACAQESIKMLESYAVTLRDLSTMAKKHGPILRDLLVSYPTVFYASIQIRLGQYTDAMKTMAAILPEHQETYRVRNAHLLNAMHLLKNLPKKSTHLGESIRWVHD